MSPRQARRERREAERKAKKAELKRAKAAAADSADRYGVFQQSDGKVLASCRFYQTGSEFVAS